MDLRISASVSGCRPYCLENKPRTESPVRIQNSISSMESSIAPKQEENWPIRGSFRALMVPESSVWWKLMSKSERNKNIRLQVTKDPPTHPGQSRRGRRRRWWGWWRRPGWRRWFPTESSSWRTSTEPACLQQTGHTLRAGNIWDVTGRRSALTPQLLLPLHLSVQERRLLKEVRDLWPLLVLLRGVEDSELWLLGEKLADGMNRKHDLLHAAVLTHNLEKWSRNDRKSWRNFKLKDLKHLEGRFILWKYFSNVLQMKNFIISLMTKFGLIKDLDLRRELVVVVQRILIHDLSWSRRLQHLGQRTALEGQLRGRTVGWMAGWLDGWSDV